MIVLVDSLTIFSRKLFITTENELNAIAKPAHIGFKLKWVNGYNNPAAIGMLTTL
jgi:hypothetical protein